MSRPSTPTALALAGSLLVFTIACSGDSQPVDTSAVPSSPAPVIGDGTWTTADGNRIPYSVAGKTDAEVTVVLVHCWMGDGSFWDAQLPALADAYGTVTFDLPGHGEATADRPLWTVSAYGEDVAELVRGLGLTDVVLVGHSMGGPVSLRAAALLSGIVRGIVAVDTLHDADFKFKGDRFESLLHAFEADFVEACENFVNEMFIEENVQAIIQQVMQAGCDEARSDTGTALIRDVGTIDMPAWFRDAGVSIRAVNAATPNPTQIETNRRYADFDAVLMNDVGHYLHMTRPDAFNELLLETISTIVGRPS